MNKKNVVRIEEARVIDFGDPRNIDDPLRDLLEEFSSVEAEMEEDLTQIEECSMEYLSSSLNDEEMVSFFESRIKLLEESRLRLKFYLDEIETFLLNK